MVTQKNLQLNIEVALDSAAAKKGLQALGGELRSLDVPVRLDTASLRSVRVPVEIDRRGLESLRIPAFVDASGSKAIGQQIADSVGEALKDLKLPGQGGFFSGLINTITAPIQSVFAGAFEGIGRDISFDLGEGVSQGIRRELAPIIGSFELLGREGAAALVRSLRAEFRDQSNVVSGVVQELVGAQAFYAEAGSVQAKAGRQQGERVVAATRYYQSERVGLKPGDIAKQQSALDKQFDALEQRAVGLLAEIRDFALNSLGGKKIQERITEARGKLDGVLEKIAATPEKDVSAHRKLSAEANQYLTKVRTLQEALDEVVAGAATHFRDREDELTDLGERLQEQQLRIDQRRQAVRAGAYLGSVVPAGRVGDQALDRGAALQGASEALDRGMQAESRDSVGLKKLQAARKEIVDKSPNFEVFAEINREISKQQLQQVELLELTYKQLKTLEDAPGSELAAEAEAQLASLAELSEASTKRLQELIQARSKLTQNDSDAATEAKVGAAIAEAEAAQKRREAEAESLIERIDLAADRATQDPKLQKLKQDIASLEAGQEKDAKSLRDQKKFRDTYAPLRPDDENVKKTIKLIEDTEKRQEKRSKLIAEKREELKTLAQSLLETPELQELKAELEKIGASFEETERQVLDLRQEQEKFRKPKGSELTAGIDALIEKNLARQASRADLIKQVAADAVVGDPESTELTRSRIARLREQILDDRNVLKKLLLEKRSLDRSGESGDPVGKADIAIAAITARQAQRKKLIAEANEQIDLARNQLQSLAAQATHPDLAGEVTSSLLADIAELQRKTIALNNALQDTLDLGDEDLARTILQKRKLREQQARQLQFLANKTGLAAPLSRAQGHQDLSSTPSPNEAKSPVVAQSATKQEDVATRLYKELVRQVAQLSGVKIDDTLIPQLRVANNLPAGAGASYRPEFKSVNVPGDLLSDLASGSPSKRTVDLLVHEIRHAVQHLFGAIKSSDIDASQLLTPTQKELEANFGELQFLINYSVEQSLKHGTQIPREQLTRMEEDAYAFARRNLDRIYEVLAQSVQDAVADSQRHSDAEVEQQARASQSKSKQSESKASAATQQQQKLRADSPPEKGGELVLAQSTTLGPVEQATQKAKEGVGFLVQVVGATARTGLDVAQDVEEVALAIIPFGKALKIAAQKFAIPTAIFTAATHALPGGETLAGLLQGALSGIVDPASGALAANAAEIATQSIHAAFAHVPFGSQIAEALINAIIPAINAAKGVLAESLVAGATAVLGGKAIQGAGQLALGAAGEQVQKVFPGNDKALPPAEGDRQPFNTPIAFRKGEEGLEIEVNTTRLTDRAGEMLHQVAEVAGKAAEVVGKAAQHVKRVAEDRGVDVGEVVEQAIAFRDQVGEIASNAADAIGDASRKVKQVAEDIATGTQTIDVAAIAVEDPWQALPAAIEKGSEQIIDVAAQEIKTSLSESQSEALTKARSELAKIMAGSQGLQDAFAKAIADGDREMVELKGRAIQEYEEQTKEQIGKLKKELAQAGLDVRPGTDLQREFDLQGKGKVTRDAKRARKELNKFRDAQGPELYSFAAERSLDAAGEALSAIATHAQRLAAQSLPELQDRLERLALIVRTTAVEIAHSEKTWEALDNLLVNVAGTLASAAGAKLGIIPQLGGDLGGALVARGVTSIGREAQAAHQELLKDEAFQTATALDKLQMVVAATATRLQSPEFQQKVGRQLTEDIIGFMVGNGAASAISAAAPVLAPVPLKGAAVAAPTVPKLADLRDTHARTIEAASAPSEPEFYAFDPRQFLDRAAAELQVIRQAAAQKLEQLSLVIQSTGKSLTPEQGQKLAQLEAEAGVQFERSQAEVKKTLESLEAEIGQAKERASVISQALEQAGVTAKEQLAKGFEELGHETRILIEQIEAQQKQFPARSTYQSEDDFARLRQEQVELLRRKRREAEAPAEPLAGVGQEPVKPRSLKPLPPVDRLGQVESQIDRGSTYLRGEQRDRFVGIEADIDKNDLSALSVEQYDQIREIEGKLQSFDRKLQQAEQKSTQGKRGSGVRAKADELLDFAVRIFRDQSPGYTEAAKKGFDGLKNAVFGAVGSLQKMGGALGPVNKGLQFLISHAKEVVIGFIAFQVLNQAGFALVQFAQDAFKTATQIDALQTSLTFAAGSSRAAAEQIAFVRAESERLNTPLLGSVKGFQQLAAAAKGTELEGEGVRKVYTALSQAARVNSLSQEDFQSLLLATTQIIGKGSVQAEELRGQIGERLPGAFQTFAKGMGISTGELSKRLELGTVGTADLSEFIDQLAKETLPGLDAALKTPQAALDGLGNQFALFQEQVGKALTPAAVVGFNLLGGVLRGIGGFLESVGKDLGVVYAVLEKAGVVRVASALFSGLGKALDFLLIKSGVLTAAIKALVPLLLALTAPTLVTAMVTGFYAVASALAVMSIAMGPVTVGFVGLAAAIAAYSALLPILVRNSENTSAKLSETRRAALEAGEAFDIKFNDALKKLQKGIPLTEEELKYLKDGFKANVAAGLDSAHTAEVLTGRLDGLQAEAKRSADAVDKLNKKVAESARAFRLNSVAIEQSLLDQKASIAEALASGGKSADDARSEELQAEAKHSQDLANLYANRKTDLAAQLAEKEGQIKEASRREGDTTQLVKDRQQLEDQLFEVSKQAAQSRTQAVQSQTAVAQEAITRSETQRSIATQALLNKGVITEEQANLQRLQSTRARIFQQIQVEGDSAQRRLELYQNDREQQQATNAIRLQEYEDVFNQEQAIIQEALNKRQITEQQAAFLSVEQEGRKLDAQLKFENQTEVERNKFKLERIKNEEQQRQALKAIEVRAIEDSVTQEQILIQKALNERQITQEQANAELLSLEHERIKAQLALEQNTTEERAKLTLELLKNEQQLQEDLRQATARRLDEEVRGTENSVQKRKLALDTINNSIEQQSRLIEAQKGLYDSINGLRDNEYDIAIKLAKNNEERAKLEQAAAVYRLNALREAQRLEREIFELKLLQEKSQRNISKIQNEAEIAKAQAERQKLDADPTATVEQKRAADLTIESLSRQRDFLDLIDSEAGRIANLQRQGLQSQQLVADRNARLNVAEKTIDPSRRNQLFNGLRDEALRGIRTPVATTGVESRLDPRDPLQARRGDIQQQLANPEAAKQLTPVDAAQQVPRSTPSNPGNVILLTPSSLQSLIQNAPRVSLAGQQPQAPQRQVSQVDPAAVVSDFVQRIQVQQRPIMIELTQNFSPDQRGQAADRTRSEVLDVLDEVTRKW